MRYALLSFILLACSACGGNSGGEGSLPGLYVNSALGSDTNPGTNAEPFETISMALSMAASGQAVQVAPGTYNSSSGETFPLVVAAGVSLVGSPGTKGGVPKLTEIILDGLVKAAVFVEAGGSVSGFHIVSTSGVAIRLDGDGAAARNNMPVGPTGIYVSDGVQGAVVEGNDVFGCKTGMHFDLGSTARVQENQLSNNVYAIFVYQAEPDFGGGALSSIGANEIHQSSLSDLYINAPGMAVFARDNCWDHAPPTQSTTITMHADVLLIDGMVDTLGALPCSGGI